MLKNVVGGAAACKELQIVENSRSNNNFGLLMENNSGIQFYFCFFGERKSLFYFFSVCRRLRLESQTHKEKFEQFEKFICL